MTTPAPDWLSKLTKGPVHYAYDHERWYCRIYEGGTEVAQAIGMGRGKKGQDECEAHAQRIMQALEPKGQALPLVCGHCGRPDGECFLDKALPELWSEEKLDSLAKHVDRNTADHIRDLQAYITHLEQRESREGKLYPGLVWFVHQMQAQLDRNADRGDWTDVHWLWVKQGIERNYKDMMQSNENLTAAVDLANFAAMFAVRTTPGMKALADGGSKG